MCWLSVVAAVVAASVLAVAVLVVSSLPQTIYLMLARSRSLWVLAVQARMGIMHRTGWPLFSGRFALRAVAVEQATVPLMARVLV